MPTTHVYDFVGNSIFVLRS